jgi:hypothetical protein
VSGTPRFLHGRYEYIVITAMKEPSINDAESRQYDLDWPLTYTTQQAAPLPMRVLRRPPCRASTDARSGQRLSAHWQASSIGQSGVNDVAAGLLAIVVGKPDTEPSPFA